MEALLCPGCGEKVPRAGLQPGDRIDCSRCAGLTLKLEEEDGRYRLVEVPKASCPVCNRSLDVPEGCGPGDTLSCCGEKFVLTYAFGAYALERRRPNDAKRP